MPASMGVHLEHILRLQTTSFILLQHGCLASSSLILFPALVIATTLSSIVYGKAVGFLIIKSLTHRRIKALRWSSLNERENMAPTHFQRVKSLA
jgi:hypothetical protein